MYGTSRVTSNIQRANGGKTLVTMIIRHLQYALHLVVDYLFPVTCVQCHAILIADKEENKRSNSLMICKKCLASLPLREPDNRILPCLSDSSSDDPLSDAKVAVAFYYQDNMVSLIHALKFNRMRENGPLLGMLTSVALQDILSSFDIAIPIPLSKKRRRKRGYNQAALIGRAVAESISCPFSEDVLVRTRYTKQQSRFRDPMIRAQNVKNAFAVDDKWDVEGLTILVIDDILTTGGTMHEAMRALYLSGAKYVAGIAVASSRKQSLQDGVSDL